MMQRRPLFALVACLAAVASCEDPLAGDTVDLSYAGCAGASDAPTWFAYQDGNGSWQRVLKSATGSYDFRIRSGKGGIALYNDESGLFVEYATADEFKANLPSCNGSVRSLTGSVTGYTTADNMQIWMGMNGAGTPIFGSSPAPAQFNIAEVDASATDLLAVRFRTADSVVLDVFPTSVLLRHNVTGTTTPLLDFSSTSEAAVPIRKTVTVTNVAAGEGLTLLSEIGMGTTTGVISRYEPGIAFSTGPVSAPFYGLSTARLALGEGQMIFLSADRTVSSNSLETRITTSVFTDPSDRSVTFGPALGTITVTGSARPTASYTVQPSYDRTFDVIFAQGNPANPRQNRVVATSGYFGGAATISLRVPDFTGVSGFSPTWLLVSGTSANWDFLATDADLSYLRNKVLTYQAARRLTAFTP